MRKQTFQHAEIRDENDNIISNGAYGKNTALSNKQNDGWVDYVMNNLERLYEKGKTDASTMTKELAKKAEKADVYTKQKVDDLLDKKMKAMIDILYPIGIVITTATDNTPKPGEEYGLAQWEEIGQNRVLQGCSTGAGSTIEAGLPNITGTAAGAMWGSVNTERNDGAFKNSAKEGLNNSKNGEFLEPKWDISKEGIRLSLIHI